MPARRDLRLPLSAALAGLGALDAGASAQFDLVPVQIRALDTFFPTCVEPADLDGDGLVDLVLSGRNVEGRIAILRGLPGGTFGPPEEILVRVQTDWVVARDFDGDGRLDLALAERRSPGQVTLLRGRGDGTFGAPERTRVGRAPTALLAADLDDDGDLDLVASDFWSDDLAVLVNDGFGGFTFAERHPLALALRRPARPFFLARADFDGDGRGDLAVNHIGSGSVSVLSGRPDGTLSSVRTLSVGAPASIAAADADGDGDVDLLAAELTIEGGSLTVLDNDGTGRFTQATDGAFALWTWFVTTGDLDGDGRPDALLTDASFASLFLRRNVSDGAIAFGPAQLVPIGGFPRMVRPVDLDGDCDLDLVTIDIAGHAVHVHRNDTPQAGCVAYDLDGDGVVGFGDLLLVLGAWGSPDPVADVNLDGVVDFLDLLELLGHWSAP